MPGKIQQALRQQAIALSVQAPGFLRHYARFYSRLIGPIEKDVTS